MPELPDLPETWTDGASAAYLLLGIAIIDGVLHDEETAGVYDRLARHVSEDDAVLEESVRQAWAYLQQVMEQGGMDAYLDSLEAHCYALRGTYDKKTLEGLVGDLAEVAQCRRRGGRRRGRLHRSRLGAPGREPGASEGRPDDTRAVGTPRTSREGGAPRGGLCLSPQRPAGATRRSR